MKNSLLKTSLTIILAFIASANLFSQCTTAGFGQYPFATYTPLCLGAPETILADAWTDEYTVISLTAGTTYTFESSVGTDYLTIATEPGNVAQVWGTGPLVFVCPASGLYRIYRHDDATCVGQMVLREIFVTCGSVPVGCVNGAMYPGPFPAPTSNLPYQITNCQWAEEYNEVTGVTAGSTFTSDAGGTGTYITVRSGTVGGPIVAQGFEPLNWTAIVTANHYIHYNTDASCGTDNSICRVTTLTCTSCPPPVFLANDNCSDVTPTIITNGAPPTTFNGNTIGANDGPGESSVLGAIAVWEAVTLTGVCNNLTVDFCGTGAGIMDPAFAVYTDCPVTVFTFASVNDFTTCGDGNLTMSFYNLPAGTYYLPVLADPAYIVQGAYTMNVSSVDCPPLLANDNCSDVTPTIITNGAPPTTFNGNTTGANDGPGELSDLGAIAVWEAVTLTGVCNNLTVDFCGTGAGIMDPAFIVYTDCPVAGYTFADNFEFTTCVDGNITITYYNLPAGTYYLPVLADPGYITQGPYTMNVSSVDCPPPPVNDDCIGAIPMGCGDVETGNTVFATPDLTAPDCSGGVGAGNGVWYSFVGNGLPFTISLCGSGYDTYLSLYSGPDCSTLTCEANNDDAPGFICGFQSEIQDFVTTPGTTYYVLVNGFFGDAGAYTLTLSVTPPTNDDCINATAIVPGVTSGNTSCANVDAAGAVGTASAPTAGGVWYSFTPGCSGSLTAGLCTGTTFNTQLSVYSGTCGALVGVVGNNDFCGTQSQVTWAGVAGTTYYILVHGNGAEEGAFDLTLTQVDNIDPVPDVLPTLPPINSSCEVTLVAPTATDNCAGVVVGTTPIMTFSSNGVYTITWTYDDGNGNTVTQDQTITINDVTPPTIGGPNDTIVGNSPGICGAVVNYITPACTNPVTYVNQTDDIVNDNGWLNEASLPQFIADDFFVPASDTWSVETFSASVWELPVGSMANITVNVHADAGGVPGAIISSQVLTSADWVAGPYLGTAFGWDITSYNFTLPTPVSGLTGGAGGTTYWLSFYENSTFFQIAWEATNVITGNSAQVGGTETGPWGLLGSDVVFSLGGTFIGTVSDDCPTCATVTQTAGLPSGSVFPAGTTTNTFVATDNGGNTAEYSFDITVVDTEAPTPDADSSAAFTFTTGATAIPILDNATATSTLVVSGAPTSLNSGDLTSVCIDITHTWDSDMDIYLISPFGTTYALSLANGGGDDNYTSTCFDMSAVTPITGGVAPFTGSFIPEGPGGFDSFNGEDPNGTWTLSVTDNATLDEGTINNFTMNFNFVYPTLLPTAFVECSAVAPTATDNCDGAVTATTLDPTSFTSDGTYTINWTYTDVAGNTSTQTQVIVADDITAPVADAANIDVTAECSITLTAPTATDACVGTVTGTTTDPTTYSALGTYTVIWTYDDGNGNTSTQTQTIIINDVTGPVPNAATLPDAVDECFATVTIFGTPTATDNCAGLIIGTTLDPLSYNVQGTYTVTWTYDDGNGNITTQTQTVIVDDNTAPLANNTNLPDVTGECTATLVAPTATDNCAGPITGTTTDPTSYSAQGTYTVTWTYDDGNGNTTTQTQTVIVDDVTAPVADVAVLADVNGECSVAITVTAPTATDACAGVITGTTTSPTTYSSAGTYSITWTYDDGNGNISTQTQNVVIGDNTAPVADLVSIDVTVDCGETVTAPTATDNCAGAITGTTTDATSFTGAGPFTITWTYDDGNGNTSTQTQTVTISDGTAPVADDASIDVSGDCSVTVTAPTATDNCAGSITGTTLDPLTYTGVGTYTVTWTYDDGNGNSSTQTQTVTIFDATAPVPDDAILPTVTGECTATVSTIPTATDGCEGAITGTTVDVLTYNSAGTYTVEWTFDDGNGNISTQTQTVVVTDNTAPVPSAALLPNVVGNCVVTVETTPTAVDNCEGTITGTTTDPLTYNAVGTYFIIWTFDDGNGNIFTQNQTVIVDPCLGIEDESGEWNALVYPNPGNGIFTLSLAEMPTEKTEIRLVNALGQVIYNGVLQAQVQQFDFTHLASATYYLMITNSQGQITKPVIIKHND